MRLKTKISLCFAFLIAGIFLFAAVGKIFFPRENLKIFEISVGVFETLVVFLLFLYYKRWETWLLVALLFASWAGYAFFWMHAKLPCSCMGTMVEFPASFTFALDCFFWGASMGLSHFLGANSKKIRMALIVSPAAGIGGYFIAHLIAYIITTPHI